MTEPQKRNNTVAVSLLLSLFKAEIERLADPGSRKPTSNAQWKPFGKPNCATKDIVEKNDVCGHSTQFTLWLTIACNHRSGLVNMGLAEKRDVHWYASLLHPEILHAERAPGDHDSLQTGPPRHDQ